jgi:chitin synthase
MNPAQNTSFWPDSAFRAVIQTANQSDTLDGTDAFNRYITERPHMQNCINNFFYIGRVGRANGVAANRFAGGNETQCAVRNYILLAASIILVSVLAFKLLAALPFPRGLSPEICNKFVICQVACHAEGEASLRRTMDSLSLLDYDDKRKLLFLVCDGMVTGPGNDRPTPRIVLDILGVDPLHEAETLPFESLGSGSSQLNYAKVYSGLYDIMGHAVPYIVVVKVGKPSERINPGSR